MDFVICARYGGGISEAKKMSQMEKRAFVYSIAILEGSEVDWETGKIVEQKTTNKPKG